MKHVTVPEFEIFSNPTINIIDLKSQRADWVHMSLSCYDWENHNNLDSCFVLKTPGNLYIARTWAGEDSLFGCKFYPDRTEMIGQDLEELKNWAKNKVLERGYRILDPKIKVMK